MICLYTWNTQIFIFLCWKKRTMIFYTTGCRCRISMCVIYLMFLIYTVHNTWFSGSSVKMWQDFSEFFCYRDNCLLLPWIQFCFSRPLSARQLVRTESVPCDINNPLRYSDLHISQTLPKTNRINKVRLVTSITSEQHHSTLLHPSTVNIITKQIGIIGPSCNLWNNLFAFAFYSNNLAWKAIFADQHQSFLEHLVFLYVYRKPRHDRMSVTFLTHHVKSTLKKRVWDPCSIPFHCAPSRCF